MLFHLIEMQSLFWDVIEKIIKMYVKLNKQTNKAANKQQSYTFYVWYDTYGQMQDTYTFLETDNFFFFFFPFLIPSCSFSPQKGGIWDACWTHLHLLPGKIFGHKNGLDT